MEPLVLYILITAVIIIIAEFYIVSLYKDAKWKKVLQYIKKRKLDQFTEGSKRVIRGQIKESFAPFTPEWGDLSVSEAHFLGKPIDYIVFDGLPDRIPDIILVEIKTGHAQQNRNEQLVEQAVKEGRIYYKVVRL